jgi:hypothetical protein
MVRSWMAKELSGIHIEEFLKAPGERNETRFPIL